MEKSTIGTYQNHIFLSGRIAGIYEHRRDEVRLALLVPRRRRDEEGVSRIVRDDDKKIVGNLFLVRFFDGAAESLKERYEVGDFVNVDAIAMTARNRYTCTDAIEIWGISIFPKAANGHFVPDLSTASFVGKVESVYSGTGRNGNDFTNITIYTNVDKTVIRQDRSKGEKNFHTYLTLGVFSDDTITLAKTLQKGDWISCNGSIRSKKNGEIRQNRISITHIEKLEDVANTNAPENPPVQKTDAKATTDEKPENNADVPVPEPTNPEKA